MAGTISGPLVVPASEVGPDLRVAALDLVVDGLADVVQEARAPRQFGVEAELLGEHGRQVGHLDRVLEDALAVAGAVLEAAEELDLLRVQAVDARIEGHLLAGVEDVLLDFLADLGNDLLDARRLDAAVGDQLGHAPAGDLAADRVERGQDDDARAYRRR